MNQLFARVQPMVFKSILFLLSSALISGNTTALSLDAEGYGPSLDEAKNEALKFLASNIFVQIESTSELYLSDSGENYFSSTTQSTTDLPLLGVKYQCEKVESVSHCLAKLDSEQSLSLYISAAESLAKEIQETNKAMPEVAGSIQYDVYSSLLAKFEQLDKYKTVVRFLSRESELQLNLTVTKSDIKSKLLTLEKSASSLDVAAKLLSRNISGKRIYIRPATLEMSQEVTPFAKVIATELRKHLNGAETPEEASYYFSGAYQIHDKGIFISYTLQDKKGNSLTTNVVNIAPEAYSHLRAQPNEVNFDKLLHSGYVISSDFKVDLATNRGSRQLHFEGGEEIELIVKMNDAGYFYIVGYTKNNDQELAYLLELNDARGEQRFVEYYNAEMANKWVSLAKFRVSAPFGFESLQLIASTKDLRESLPDYTKDHASGYYLLSKDMEEGLRKTRALKKVKNNNTKAQMIETVLTFTTSD